MEELTVAQVTEGIIVGPDCNLSDMVTAGHCAYCGAVNATHLVSLAECGCTVPVCCACVKNFTLGKHL